MERTVTAFLIVALCAAVFSWIAALMRECGIRPVRRFWAFLNGQTKVGSILLGAFFTAMWLIAGTKPNGRTESHPYTSLQTRVGVDGDSSADSVGRDVPVAPNCAFDGDCSANSDAVQSVGVRPQGLAPRGGLAAQNVDEWSDFAPITSTNTARTLAAEDFRRGFVMHRVGTNEAHDFSAPSNATVCADWEAFGAAEDWFYLSLTNWVFRVGTNDMSRLRVFSFGQADLRITHPYTSLQTRVGVGGDSSADSVGRFSSTAENVGKSGGAGRPALPVGECSANSVGRDVPVAPRLWPLRTTLGIVPRANWHMIAGNESAAGNAASDEGASASDGTTAADEASATGDAPSADDAPAPSRFWHFVTPSNTLQLTWQNALLGRRADAPISFQAELWPNGRFAYRYDLSRCGAAAPTNVLVGASFAGGAWATNALPTNITSLAFHPLAAEDAESHDRDGDGLSLMDELFALGTDPLVIVS